VAAAYGAFGDDASGYLELTETEYLRALHKKWPVLAHINKTLLADRSANKEELDNN
jgi:hypothetical protein